jgi:hypothetical protein
MIHNEKNKLFWILFGSTILLFIALTFKKTFTEEDFYLFQQVQCDPSFESCFVELAEDLCAESEDPDCISVTEDHVYKTVLKRASTVPVCNPSEEQGISCDGLLSCEPSDSEEDCYYDYCEVDCAEPLAG